MIDSQQWDKLLRMARLIAVLYLASTAVLAVIAYLLPHIMDQPVQYEPSIIIMLISVLGLMSLISIVLGFILPARIIKTAEQHSNPSQKFFVATVLGCALFETPAICGLALAVLGAGLPIALGFIIASAGFMLYTFPTEEKISHFPANIPK